MVSRNIGRLDLAPGDARGVCEERGFVMRRLNCLYGAMSLALLAAAGPAQAGVTVFTGSVTGIGVVTPNAGCDPRRQGNIDPATTSGASTLGAFTYSHTVCTSGPPGGPIDGTFAISFGSDGFFGTLAGASAASPTMAGIFDFSLAYTVLGGTGRFLSATGAFATGPGSYADTNFRPSRITLRFENGLISAPGIPEPQTWALLILGFGIIGGALRGRRARLAFA